jgi:hypothetical protein
MEVSLPQRKGSNDWSKQKLDQLRARSAAQAGEPMRKPRKVLTPQRRMNEAIWMRFGNSLARAIFPMPCDGSCLTRESANEMSLRCEDGESLRMYYCFHERTFVLTNYMPAL